MSRTNKRLQRARSRIINLQEEIREYYWGYVVNSDLLELRNIATVAELIIQCALQRPESRGLHYNPGFPGRGSGVGAARHGAAAEPIMRWARVAILAVLVAQAAAAQEEGAMVACPETGADRPSA